MSEVTPTSSRKNDHIHINLEKDVASSLSTGLEHFHFIHQALPEINLEDVDLSQTLFQRNLQAPILISSMTGGTEEAARINQLLACAAQTTGLAMGLGSQRAAIERPELSATFQVRRFAPDILLFANLGAIQLNYAYSVDDCKRVVDMVEADALILHLNALQEAIQPDGDTRFAGLITKIENVCRQLSVPVVVKEVGWGISAQTARILASAGVTAIDVAGAGGTSWSQVELYRLKNENLARVAAAFRDWGIPTSKSLIAVHQAVPDTLLFASGGLRDGLDIAKCIALGATLGGMASPFLKAAARSEESILDTILQIKKEIQICMFAAGAGNLVRLKQTPLVDDTNTHSSGFLLD